MHSFLKVFSFLACFVSVLSNGFGIKNSRESSDIVKRFGNWVVQHNISTSDEHKIAHIFENWLSNDKYIDMVNSQNLTYTLNHNAFSGMNTKEFGDLMGFKANKDYISKDYIKSLRGSVPFVFPQSNVLNLEALPASVDWRLKGKVNKVMNQMQCGSCWAFSGTSTLESAVAIKTGTLYDLSEQQAVSCSGLKYGNLGCNGGMYNNLWNWDKDNGGQCSEKDYPYTSGSGQTGTCVKTCVPVPGTKIQSYTTVTAFSDSALMTALTVGTVSIAIEADTRSFQLYGDGIYTDFEGCNANAKTKGVSSQPNIDHAVVLVGYGTVGSQDYYILRNSWDTTWGEQGYMRIAKGDQFGKYGMCGLLSEPMYPVV